MSEAVFYFGGYRANQQDIDAWLRSARLQRPAIKFRGFPYPTGASSAGDSAVKAFGRDGKLDSVIDGIQKNDADTIYIVGHSSGCAISNAVDAGIDDPDKNTVLVALDGFTPSNAQLKRPSTQVWGAKCNGVPSRNLPSNPTGLLKDRLRVFIATNCTKMWPLHFSLVNANASNDLIGDDITKGYANCRANLLFLGRSMELP